MLIKKKVFSMVGTVDYIAPEVFQKEGYNETVDFWSLGTILFEMLLGYPPFCGKTPSITLHNVINFEKTFKIPSDNKLSFEAVDLMKKLITRADKRIGKNGTAELKAHPFFKSINWNNIRNTVAPIIPKLSNEEDTRNFEKFDMTSKWVPVFYNKSSSQRNEGILFIGYTYKKPVELDSKKEIEQIFERLKQKKEMDGKRNFSEDRLQVVYKEPSSASKIGSNSKMLESDQKQNYNFFKKPRMNEYNDKSSKSKFTDAFFKNYTMNREESGTNILKSEVKKTQIGNMNSSTKMMGFIGMPNRDSEVSSKVFQKQLQSKPFSGFTSKLITLKTGENSLFKKQPVPSTSETISKIKSSFPIQKPTMVQGMTKVTTLKPTTASIEVLKAKTTKGSEKILQKSVQSFLKPGVFSSIKKG